MKLIQKIADDANVTPEQAEAVLKGIFDNMPQIINEELFSLFEMLQVTDLGSACGILLAHAAVIEVEGA